jgi:hypothetical protein
MNREPQWREVEAHVRKRIEDLRSNLEARGPEDLHHETRGEIRALRELLAWSNPVSRDPAKAIQPTRAELLETPGNYKY